MLLKLSCPGWVRSSPRTVIYTTIGKAIDEPKNIIHEASGAAQSKRQSMVPQWMYQPTWNQCATLHTLPKHSEIVPVKLKRKLVYKGHHMCEYIHPQKVMNALLWLTDNNKFYNTIPVCDDWEDIWNEEDQDLWEAMTAVDHQQSSTIAGNNESTTVTTPTANDIQCTWGKYERSLLSRQLQTTSSLILSPWQCMVQV